MSFVLLLLLSQAQTQPAKHHTPWFLPRYATVQVMFRPGTAAPAVRLGWEVDLIAMQRDVLTLNLELGGSFTHASPTVGLFYQHVILGGLGYRMQRESGLHWGFFFGAGPAFYGYRLENRISPYIEGRGHLGWKLGPVTLSLCAGYAQWLTLLTSSLAQLYLGGVFVGVQLGWK